VLAILLVSPFALTSRQITHISSNYSHLVKLLTSRQITHISSNHNPLEMSLSQPTDLQWFNEEVKPLPVHPQGLVEMKEEVKGSITDQETEQLRELPETVPEYPLLSFDQISRSEDSSLKAATSNSMLRSRGLVRKPRKSRPAVSIWKPVSP